MIRLVLGLALLPTSALTLWAAVRVLGSLAAAGSATALPFLGGLAAASAAWLFARHATVSERGPVGWLSATWQRFYVAGHELTHALAAWSVGAKVLGMKVGDKGGHVDLSHSNAFIALAPYCVPIYTVFAIVLFRFWAWLSPGAPRAPFLLLLGLSLSFHWLMTFESLWDAKQPDLAAAGGVLFSLAWIGLANGLAVLLLLKFLFPRLVPLAAPLAGVARRSAGFWLAAYRFVKPVKASFLAQLRA